MRQVALARTRALRAQAVLDIGFEETLGVLNVTVGTDMHKRILKANYAASGEKEVPQLYASLGMAITRRLAATEPAFAVDASSSALVADLFGLVRFAMACGCGADAWTSGACGCRGLSRCLHGVSDAIEEATAKAAVMPLPRSTSRAGCAQRGDQRTARHSHQRRHARHHSHDGATRMEGWARKIHTMVVKEGRSFSDAAVFRVVCSSPRIKPAIGAAALLYTLAKCRLPLRPSRQGRVAPIRRGNARAVCRPALDLRRDAAIVPPSGQCAP